MSIPYNKVDDSAKLVHAGLHHEHAFYASLKKYIFVYAGNRHPKYTQNKPLLTTNTNTPRLIMKLCPVDSAITTTLSITQMSCYWLLYLHHSCNLGMLQARSQ